MPRSTQRSHDALFVCRFRLGEHGALVDARGSSVIVEPLDVVARHYMSGAKPDRVGDVLRRVPIVAGDHLHGDAGGSKPVESSPRAPGFGGSANVTRPINVMSCSSSMLNSEVSGRRVRTATPRTRRPSAQSPSNNSSRSAAISPIGTSV